MLVYCIQNQNRKCNMSKKFSKKWIDHFFKLCTVHAEMSKDPSTKVGAIIVTDSKQILNACYNGFPIGIEDDPVKVPELYNDRQMKLSMTVHGEANIVALSARYGIRLEGTHLFVSLVPCKDCAKLLIQAGIKSVYYKKDNKPIDNENDWRLRINESLDLMDKAGIKLYECK